MIDVLIIGAGAAGLSAALTAKENVDNVVVLSKTQPTYSQSVQAQGGINAVLYDDNDSIEEHINDTYLASKKISNKENIRFLCNEAKNTIHWLDNLGVPFNRDSDNKIAQRRFGGTKKIRTCYSSDYTGLKIVHTLYDQCIKNDITIIPEKILLNLIVEDNKCIGVTVLNINNSEVEEYLAKNVILASGGYAGVYTNFTTNSVSNTGDGIAAAYNVNVELSNMEFVQFHPTTLEESNILISESARGEGGYLLDNEYKRFIDELKPRDVVAREIYNKRKDGKVYLDLRHLGKEKITQIMPQERELAYRFSNVLLEEELLPITPASHYTMGGIKSDIKGQTNIKNLFVCGEVAQASIHGANRLGGNSLLEIITLGKYTGLNAAQTSLNTKSTTQSNNEQINKDIKSIQSILSSESSLNFYDIKNELGKIMFEFAGLFRDENGLNTALKKINNWKEKLPQMGVSDKSTVYNQNLVDFIEFKNMLLVSELIILSALNRCESRGSHYRTDYQLEDDLLVKDTLLVQTNDGKISIKFEEIIHGS